MPETENSGLDEVGLRRLFRLSLLLKALFATLEMMVGAALDLLSGDRILLLVRGLTRRELLDDPNDLVANFLMQSAQALSLDQKSAAALYLITHGGIKLFLVINVLREKAWAYPGFMIALSLFIAYQSYQLSHGFSLWLSVLTFFDLFVLVLTFHEYRLRRGSLK